MRFDIQPFTLQDIPHIQHLQPKGWNDISVDLMAYCMNSFCKPIKVVIHHRIVGIGVVIYHERSAWLAHIIVDESSRGQGIAKMIVRFLIALATKYGSLTI
ncbi:MAG: GNAT family N-acetyltransferase, partial [Sphingobacterium sp.]